ncbi:NAD(P)H-binding protein [Vibrio sp. SS-MA-C1-2]|uniref:NAD(P)H-binding protein n=1 Tax=Vibrio sp. SS-MA-C1-2 TaxID=2908646 RepID=UPI001F3A3F3D|nr:NAD(P)H-binding protein [Vibrio sp. SS-MA-C1-2]UJF18219.1 NAD(P)H-binding protein [Vibrio sp. SS-MA-C1-2]
MVISIIGTGWLGLPLAKKLTEEGHTVFASKQTQDGISQLKQMGINSFFCQLTDENNQIETEALAMTLKKQNCEILIGAFPPGFRRGAGEQYSHQWQQLVSAAQQTNIKKIIMVSSTTVYPSEPEVMEEPEASLDKAKENTAYSENSRIMLQAEDYLINSEIDYSILRFSGLINQQRHPSRFVLHLKQVSKAAPANMLHLDDAISSIQFAINQLTNEIVNVTTPNTVSKADFYQAALNAVNSENNLPPVVDIPDKSISTKKLIAQGFKYKYHHILEAI